MANIGPNRGRRIRLALSRFSAMLIEEAKDLTGMTYPELDLALDLPSDQAYRWSKFAGKVSSTGNTKERSPQAGSMRALENSVAKLLGRPAHGLVVENNGAIDNNDLGKSLAVADLAPGLNLRSEDSSELQIGYEHDWPTYRRLKYSLNVNLLEIYRWQWKVLWDPEVRRSKGDAEVEQTIMELFENAKRERALLNTHNRYIAGNEP